MQDAHLVLDGIDIYNSVSAEQSDAGPYPSYTLSFNKTRLQAASWPSGRSSSSAITSFKKVPSRPASDRDNDRNDPVSYARRTVTPSSICAIFCAISSTRGILNTLFLWSTSSLCGIHNPVVLLTVIDALSRPRLDHPKNFVCIPEGSLCVWIVNCSTPPGRPLLTRSESA
jgi:hypothetical protein